MLLSFTAINNSQELREFSCYIPDLEVGLGLLDRIAAKGDAFQTIKLVDENSCTELPSDAFDGEPVLAAVQQLKQQWQTVLDEPVWPTLAENDWHINLTRHRLQLMNDKIDHFRVLINHIELLRYQTDVYLVNQQRKAKLINRYDQMLGTYQQYLDRATNEQKSVVEKLSRLEQKRKVSVDR